MSWQIPTQIEQDIISGKATYKTFQTGSGGQSILPVPPNSYAVIFGYDFSPAGGGIFAEDTQNFDPQLVSTVLRRFETQQISFYTGTDFYPFIHHIDSQISSLQIVTLGVTKIIQSINSSPIARQVYITSSNDITVTVGLILADPVATQNAIPVTNRTPQGLTYGGSGQVINTQTDFGPALAPQQFMQPSPKDYADFGFGLLPANADGQAFATPDTARGLYDPSAYLATLGASFRDAAACNYFLCLHYAIYTQTVPEQRG
jgi:hypothetical protein